MHIGRAAFKLWSRAISKSRFSLRLNVSQHTSIHAHTLFVTSTSRNHINTFVLFSVKCKNWRWILNHTASCAIIFPIFNPQIFFQLTAEITDWVLNVKGWNKRRGFGRAGSAWKLGSESTCCRWKTVVMVLVSCPMKWFKACWLLAYCLCYLRQLARTAISWWACRGSEYFPIKD